MLHSSDIKGTYQVARQNVREPGDNSSKLTWLGSRPPKIEFMVKGIHVTFPIKGFLWRTHAGSTHIAASNDVLLTHFGGQSFSAGAVLTTSSTREIARTGLVNAH